MSWCLFCYGVLQARDLLKSMDALTLKLGQENQYIFDCVQAQLQCVCKKSGPTYGDIVGLMPYPTYLMWNYAKEVPVLSFDDKDGLVFTPLENLLTQIIDDLLACVTKVLRALRMPLRLPQPSAEMFQRHITHGKSVTALNQLALEQEWPQHAAAKVLLNVVPFWQDPDVMALSWKTVVAPVGHMPHIDCDMWFSRESDNRQFFLSHWGAYYIMVEREHNVSWRTVVIVGLSVQYFLCRFQGFVFCLIVHVSASHPQDILA